MEKDKESEAKPTPNAKTTQEKDAAAQTRPDSTRPPKPRDPQRDPQRPSQGRSQREAPPQEGKSRSHDNSRPSGSRPNNSKNQRREQNEDFGNRKEYQPSQAIGGYYREPMSGGDQWRRRPQRQHQPPREIEGVLSVNQPTWQQHLARQSEQERNPALTMRQQEHTSQSLERNRSQNSSLRSHEPQAEDPDAVWSRFMDDLKRGKIHPDGRPKRPHRNHRHDHRSRDKHPHEKQRNVRSDHTQHTDPSHPSEQIDTLEKPIVTQDIQTSQQPIAAQDIQTSQQPIAAQELLPPTNTQHIPDPAPTDTKEKQ
ncbi:hypothetical protein L6R29_06030 [Myxococcota bacterium]|nr:hypothetical protein [Myxococcota bacterium]